MSTAAAARVTAAANAAVRVHSTDIHSQPQLLLDLSKAHGVLYFCPEMSMILAKHRDRLPRELLEFSFFLNYNEPTAQRPWTGDDLRHIYSICDKAASRIMHKRWADPHAPPDLFLVVCRGGKVRSRFAAQLITRIQQTAYTGPVAESEELVRMAESLATTPPWRHETRRVPAKNKRKRSATD